MANTPQSKIKATGELPQVTINANGTDYKVSIFLFNARGESRFIDSSSFHAITIETTHNTPFILGHLALTDELNSSALNKVDLGIEERIVMKKASAALSEINNYGDGEEFLRIKITSKSSQVRACTYTDDVILDKIFVIQNKVNTVQNNIKLVLCYFIDVVYTHFAYKKREWSTDLLNEIKLRGDTPRRGQSLVNSGRALKHILKHFSDADDIIDEENWDDGRGTVYYTLPAGEPALNAISEIMKSYVSTDESGGILTYYNGKFQLRSIRSNINKLYKTTQNKNKKETILSSNFAGAIKIQTGDNRQNYTNKEAVDLFGVGFNYIPVDLKNITFVDMQPNAALTALDKKEVIQFDPVTKQFYFHSDQGTVAALSARSSVQSLPDGNEGQLNIDQSTTFSNTKTKLFKITSNNTVMHSGNIRLQKQLLDSLTKAKFSCLGNIDMSANKFIYMTLNLKNKNKFANKIPGFWYITSNLTTMSKGVYANAIECVKLDKPQ